MKKSVAVPQTFIIALFCTFQFALTNSTGVPQNISTNNTSTNMSSEMEAENIYNHGNNILEPSIDINEDMVKDNSEKYKDPVGNPMENSEETKNILSNDTPVILTLSESSSIELEKFVDASLVSTSTDEKVLSKNTSGQERSAEDIKTNVVRFSSEIPPQNKTHVPENSIPPDTNKNATEDQNEEIPSFSEWAQKRLEEVEKNEQINSSAKGQTVNGKGTTAKLRWKNYASLDCGAKVIAANPESVSPGAVLSPSSDEYKLNTCTSRIWFVVELCEAIQTKKIDLANYELFSSSPKDFVVSVSDRYPTRDWSIAGKFTAKDERDIQSFDLDTHIFGKYIKVEIKSHYGSEHYCPISLFRAYGTSVFEVLQKEDPGISNPADDDDDDDDDDNILNVNNENDDSQKNLFSSATDAVMSIVKRAAEALGNKMNNHTTQEKNETSLSLIMNSCTSPSHLILCKNCSDLLFGQIYELVSCEFSYMRKLVQSPFISKALSNSPVCNSFGYEITSINYINSFTDYIGSFFPMRYINALCYEMSVIENRGILNISQQFSNKTGNITTEQIINLKIESPPKSTVKNSSELENLDETLEDTFSADSHNLSSSGGANLENDLKENITNVSQIKPTKTLTPEIQIIQTEILLNSSNTSDPVVPPEKTVTPESAESISPENPVENSVDATTEIEGMDALDDHLEHFIPEFNTDNQNVPVATSTTTNTPQGQKESVFLRLSNRIKVLERNMSLSSQYLEELSRRYKKQVEEMQHLLEKTIVTLQEESQKKDLRNKELEDRLDNLAAAMETLVSERHNWALSMYCLMTSTLVFLGIYFFCRKSTTSGVDPARENKENVEVLRRKSIDVVTHNVPVKKKRRPSDQALKIVHSAALNSEDEKHKSKRKRKKRNLVRSNSISAIKDNCSTSGVKSEENSIDWVERNNHLIEDLPFVLDESDHTTLEPYPLEQELVSLKSTNDVPTTPDSSLIETSSQNRGSQNISQEETVTHSENHLGNKANYGTGEPVKKEKRSFKKLLKKVF